MAAPRSVWGLDIGSCALKALKLANVDGELQVEAFDIIEHPKILSQPDADRRELVHVALEQFLARNSIAGSAVAISVPGQSSFTRFVKLPPVEDKNIPRIVQFEAEQQIPFKIEEVIWRWQTFHDPDSPEVELGIFAMKKTDVAEMLSHFTDVELAVDVVQMAPLGLYNFMTFDQQLAGDGATLLVDVGADKTDLVVADGARIWTRTVQIGGNNFTEALVRAFKLSFAKAEKLKRTAASSKYARQIFQAMRPVFADLVQEIQRSIGYYTSLHRESRFTKLLGLGNGFRLPGLQKFLEQNLSVPVVRIDSYNRIVPSSTVNAPTFTENVLSFAVAYGLALQGLDVEVPDQNFVTTNLLPGEVASQRAWHAKRLWFTAAAALVLVSLGFGVYSASRDGSALGGSEVLASTGDLATAQGIVRDMDSLGREYQVAKTGLDQSDDSAKNTLRLLGYRQVWPCILKIKSELVRRRFEDQVQLRKLGETAGDEKAYEAALKALGRMPRYERRVMFEDSMTAAYKLNIDAEAKAGASAAGPAPTPGAAAAGQEQGRKGFMIVLKGRTPLPRRVTARRLQEIANMSPAVSREISAFRELDSQGRTVLKPPLVEIVKTIVELEEQKTPAGRTPSAARPTYPMGGATPSAGRQQPVEVGDDPLFPTESSDTDTSFKLTWYVAVNGSGVEIPGEKQNENPPGR